MAQKLPTPNRYVTTPGTATVYFVTVMQLEGVM